MTISFLTEHGRFLARVHGFTPGNVLLRREQYRRADDLAAAAEIARPVVVAKIANSRTVLLRALRDHIEKGDGAALGRAAVHLDRCLSDAQTAPDLDALPGVEGEAARVYFGVFDHLITAQKEGFAFRERSRRPPLDRVNALLSFLYAMLAHDARAACEAAGLDPAVGFLHRDRPGRPGLALDLMEELRAFLGEKTTVGLLLHLQARLLARYLRGDLDGYPPFIWR